MTAICFRVINNRSSFQNQMGVKLTSPSNWPLNFCTDWALKLNQEKCFSQLKNSTKAIWKIANTRSLDKAFAIFLAYL